MAKKTKPETVDEAPPQKAGMAGNPFFAPHFLRALSHLDARAPLIEAERHVLPVVKAGFPYISLAISQNGPYAPLSNPRLSFADLPALAARLQEGLAEKGYRFLRLPNLCVSSGGGEFLKAFEARGSNIITLSSHARAAFISDLDAESYFKTSMSTKRRKRAREAVNRLTRDGGRLRFLSSRSHGERQVLLETYRSLEKDGWKGREGTAFAKRKETDAFLQDLVAGAPDDVVLTHALYLDGTPLAAGITLHDEGAAWYWKTAYNEAFAQMSPGVVFTMELTRHLKDDLGISHIDSCAMPNHPMIDGLWSERLQMADVVIDLAPKGCALTPLCLRLERDGKARIKRLLRR